MLDERSEHLINRKLDGELAEGELLELQKTLIRSPEARALLEEYEQYELLAAEALRAAVQGGRLRTQAEAERAAAALTRVASTRRWALLLPAAAAAAVLALAYAAVFMPSASRSPIVAQDPPGRTAVTVASAAGDELARFDFPRRQNERLQRNVLGVYDEDTRSIYLLELDQQETTVEPVSMNY